MAPRKIKRGRPIKGMAGGKTAAFSTRITPELRKRLEQSAAESGTSLSDEIERRLWLTFRLDDEKRRMFAKFGNPQNYAACRIFADLMKELSAAAGKPWAEDRWTFDQFAKGATTLLNEWRPAGDAVKPDIRHYPPDAADRLGELLAGQILLALELTDAGKVSSKAPAGSWLATYGLLKSDLEGDKR